MNLVDKIRWFAIGAGISATLLGAGLALYFDDRMDKVVVDRYGQKDKLTADYYNKRRGNWAIIGAGGFGTSAAAYLARRKQPNSELERI